MSLLHRDEGNQNNANKELFAINCPSGSFLIGSTFSPPPPPLAHFGPSTIPPDQCCCWCCFVFCTLVTGTHTVKVNESVARLCRCRLSPVNVNTTRFFLRENHHWDKEVYRIQTNIFVQTILSPGSFSGTLKDRRQL